MHPFLRDGIEQGLEKGLAPLARVFEWRLGRPLTESERSRLAKRMTQGDSAALGDVVINLSPEQLAAWLAPRRTSKRTG